MELLFLGITACLRIVITSNKLPIFKNIQGQILGGQCLQLITFFFHSFIILSLLHSKFYLELLLILFDYYMSILHFILAGLNGGVMTSIAVLIHEVPHELADFAILVQSGLTVKQALFLNVLSSLTSFVGMCSYFCIYVQLITIKKQRQFHPPQYCAAISLLITLASKQIFYTCGDN